MDMPHNTFKAALAEGKQQIGLWCTIPDSGVVEMLAGCGYDWMLVDTEHAPVHVEATLAALQALAAYPVSAALRVPWNDPVAIKKALDLGAQTIFVPYVQNADEAAAAVSAIRYPPLGLRGVAGTTRASRYGRVKGYTENAHTETCLIVQAETSEALAQVEAIAGVKGIDGVFIGPSDLSASMGFPGQPYHPEVKAAIIDAIHRLKQVGCPVGVLSLDQAFLAEINEAGAGFMAVGLDLSLLKTAAESLLAGWR